MNRGTQSSSSGSTLSRERSSPASLIAAALVPCLPLLPLLVREETLWFRDFSLYFVPMKAALAELWRTGAVPLWDPYLRNGLPFLANPQTGVFYPPNLLVVLLGVNPGLTLLLLLHYAAAGIGFFLFLRACSFRPPAALVGAIGFGLGGTLASLANVLNNLQSAVWVPWMLLAALQLTRRPTRPRWLALVLACALAILGGELQLAALGLVTALILSLTAAAEVPSTPAQPTVRPTLRVSSRRLRGGALVACAVIAACGLVAVQLLPTAELVSLSVRQGGLPFELASDDSLEPVALTTLAFPRPALPGGADVGPRVTEHMPWLLSSYMGISVVLLAALGVGAPRRRWTVLWCALGLTGALLALGSHSPLFRWAYEVLPGFRTLRYPEKFLLLTALALPALAAAGLEGLLAGRVGMRPIVAGALGVLLSAAGSVAWMHDPARPSPALALAGAGTVCVAFVGIALLARSGRLRAGVAAGALCVLVAVDLGCAAQAVNPSVSWDFYRKPWAARVLEAQPEPPDSYRLRSSPLAANMEQVAAVTRARIFSNHYFFQQSLAPNLGGFYGFYEQDGMAGIETWGSAYLIDVLAALDTRDGLALLRLLGVRYIVTSFALPVEDVAPVATHPELPIGIVRLRGALPRAYVASRWEVLSDPRAALRRAIERTSGAPGSSGETRRSLGVVLDRAPFAARESVTWTAGADSSVHEAAAVRRATWAPASARFELDLDSPGVLVVTDSHYPGWRATLDGRSVPLLVANGYQRAVAVPVGRHRVGLQYRPESFIRGAAVSAVSALLLAILIVLPAPHVRRDLPRTSINGSDARPSRSDDGFHARTAEEEAPIENEVTRMTAGSPTGVSDGSSHGSPAGASPGASPGSTVSVSTE